MLWSIVWMLLANDSPNDDGKISGQEKDYINSTILARNIDAQLRSSSYSFSTTEVVYRWEVILTSLPVFALAVNHFAHEWIVYLMTIVIPEYLNVVLHMDFKKYSVGTLVLPSVGFWCVMVVTAGAADRLQAYGVLGVNKIRKLMQTIGAVLTAAMVSSVLLMDCHRQLATLSILTIGLSVCGLQYSGALVAHLDFVPGCAGVTMGAVSALGASVHFVLPGLIRIILHSPHQSFDLNWTILLLLTASCHIFAALLFLVFGSSPSSCWSSTNQMLPLDDGSGPGIPGGVVVVGGRGAGGGGGGGDGAKSSIDNGGVIFDAPKGEFPVLNAVDYFSNARQHSLRRSNHHQHHHHSHQQQQQQQQSQTDRSDDVYLEALDVVVDDSQQEDDDGDDARSSDGDRPPPPMRSASPSAAASSSSSSDSCSHSCVSAASEISEAYLASTLNRPTLDASAFAARPSGPSAMTVLDSSNLSESIV